MDLGLLHYDIFNSIGFKPLQCMAVLFDPDKVIDNDKDNKENRAERGEKEKETDMNTKLERERERVIKMTNLQEKEALIHDERRRRKKGDQKEVESNLNVGEDDVVEEIFDQTEDCGSNSIISTAFCTPLSSPHYSRITSSNDVSLKIDGIDSSLYHHDSNEKLEEENVPISSSSSCFLSPSFSTADDWQFIYNVEIWHNRGKEFQIEKQ